MNWFKRIFSQSLEDEFGYGAWLTPDSQMILVPFGSSHNDIAKDIITENRIELGNNIPQYALMYAGYARLIFIFGLGVDFKSQLTPAQKSEVFSLYKQLMRYDSNPIVEVNQKGKRNAVEFKNAIGL